MAFRKIEIMQVYSQKEYKRENSYSQLYKIFTCFESSTVYIDQCKLILFIYFRIISKT